MEKCNVYTCKCGGTGWEVNAAGTFERTCPQCPAGKLESQNLSLISQEWFDKYRADREKKITAKFAEETLSETAIREFNMYQGISRETFERLLLAASPGCKQT